MVEVREWQWMAVNPLRQISKFKEAQGRTRFLSDEERQRLLDVCSSSKNTHLFTLVTLALSTGMRRDQFNKNGDNFLKLIHIYLIVRILISYYTLVPFNHYHTRSLIFGAKNGLFLVG